MRRPAWLLLVVGSLTACAGPAGPALPSAAIPAVTGEVLPGWTDFTFPGKRKTLYVADLEDGRRIVRARAASSASMLRRRVRVDSRHIDGVEFSWQATSLIAGADLSDADASDSPVRVVLAFDGDQRRLSTRNRMLFDLAQALTGEAPPFATLMYVWDNRAACETLLHSGRTDRVRKIVVESGEQRRGRWLHYRRDVVADFRRAFGEDPGMLIGIALMTDTDNTRSNIEASYGEVKLLVSEDPAH